MKKLSIKIAIMAMLLANAIQVHGQQFTLSGKLSGQANAPIILNYINSEGKKVQDTAFLKNGNFIFKGNISGGILANLSTLKQSSMFKPGMQRNYVEFFLEPKGMTVTGELDNLTELQLTGSKTNQEFEPLRNQIASYNEGIQSLQKKCDSLSLLYAKIHKANEDDKKLGALGNTVDSLKDALAEPYFNLIRQFISKHYDSYISAYELNMYKTYWPYKEVKSIYDNLSPDILNGYYGMQLKKFVEGIENNSTGKVAKNFTSVDLNGKQISLSDFKGKYILLDFWGSWCVPCREGVPHVKNLFAKYHKEGLDILAIAVNDVPDEWKKAIIKDGTGIWNNIMIDRSVAKNDKRRIDNDYNIHVYPSKVLVDKNGMIIGRYDGSETTSALDKKLAEIFGNKD